LSGAARPLRPLLAAIVLAAALAPPRPALAGGPPFLTDDPDAIEYKHWELYLFSTLDKAKDGAAMQTPAVEVNSGIFPNLQAHLIVPMTLALPTGGPRAYGLGDAEFGLKYRIIQETKTVPMVGVFPMLEIPTGDADRGLGNGRVWTRLPVWFQKSWGPWTANWGGGYEVNTAPDRRSNFFGSGLLQRKITEQLTLGGEIAAHGPNAGDGRTTVLYNFGGLYSLTEHCQLLFSVGHSLTGDRDLIAYVGLYWTWGPEGRKEEKP
jgi:hypothetical protein